MFKELYNQLLHDLLGSLFKELKDIHQSDDWIVKKILSSLSLIVGTLIGMVLLFVPTVIMYALMVLLTVLLIPFYWISVKVRKVFENIASNASHKK